jgi:hypothetical protein
MYYKSQKIKNYREANLLGNNAALALKRQDFVQIFCCRKTVLNKSGSGTGARTGVGSGTQTFPK